MENELSLQEYVNQVGSSLKARRELNEMRDEIKQLRWNLDRVQTNWERVREQRDLSFRELKELKNTIKELPFTVRLYFEKDKK